LKILFVHSGNSKQGVVSFIKSQGDALVKQGITVGYYPIFGKGIFGYLKNIRILKKFVRTNKYDIIHSHYALSGWVAVLAIPQIPIIVSFMGSDVYGSYNKNGKLKWFSIFYMIAALILQLFAKKIIVKSRNIANYVYLKSKMTILPNGVNISNFDNETGLSEYSSDKDIKKILFMGNPNDNRKNIKLINDALLIINKSNYKIVTPYPIEYSEVEQYYRNADVLVLTSYNEGSPNVIKEAMTCNCPIVSTNVGDVKWLIDGVEGCYLTSFDPIDVATKVEEAIRFGRRTAGRRRIIDLGLDSITVTNKLISVYTKCIDKNEQSTKN